MQPLSGCSVARLSRPAGREVCKVRILYVIIMYIVYILFSESSLKYYTGQTDNLENRLRRHNSGLSLSTKSGKPCEIIYEIGFPMRSEAMLLEKKIKKRGAKRYLEDIGFF